MKQGFVYILTNKRNGTLYVGATSDLVKRIWEHRNKVVAGFTAKYNISMLVYYEMHDDISSALYREKQLKAWQRVWKLRIIENINTNWNDLYDDICG